MSSRRSLAGDPLGVAIHHEPRKEVRSVRVCENGCLVLGGLVRVRVCACEKVCKGVSASEAVRACVNGRVCTDRFVLFATLWL